MPDSISGMVSDWDHRSWDYDIASFARAKEMLERFRSPGARAFCIRNMQRVQEKYPNHIRHSEIPNE